MINFQSLPEANAFHSGADLWIVPDGQSSPWLDKIDWYCNLQFLKSSRHMRREVPTDLKKIVEETGSDLVDIRVSSKAPLMVSTAFFLPNANTVVVPFEENSKAWLVKCHYVWQRMKNPSLRLFLPSSLDLSYCQLEWPKVDTHQVIGVVG